MRELNLARALVLALAASALPLAAAPLAAERVIGVVLLTRSHQFFRDLADELQSRAAEAGFRFEIDYAEFDAAREAQIVARFIQRRCDAVLLSPADSRRVDESVERLNQAGIPVFTVDIANEGPKGKVISHIASDNYQGGRTAATLMAEALRGKGKVVIINHPKVTSVQERVQGFRDGLVAWPGIQVVADIPSWGQRSRARSIMDDFMLMMPDVNGVFAINDDSAMGALRSIESAGGAKGIVIVGYDGTPEVRAEIDRGKVFADIVQYPRDLAREAVRSLSDWFAGKAVQKVILLPVGVYRR
jgi:ribose transport system substrate-binding protein